MTDEPGEKTYTEVETDGKCAPWCQERGKRRTLSVPVCLDPVRVTCGACLAVLYDSTKDGGAA